MADNLTTEDLLEVPGLLPPPPGSVTAQHKLLIGVPDDSTVPEWGPISGLLAVFAPIISRDARPSANTPGVLGQTYYYKVDDQHGAWYVYTPTGWFLLVDNTTGSTTTAGPTITLRVSAPTVKAGGIISFFATPASDNALIQKVEFFVDGAAQPVDTVTSDPYSTDYNPQATGPHTVTAKVTDSLGRTQRAQASFTVVAQVANIPPTAGLTVSATTITLGQSLTLIGNAQDADGTIKKGAFYNGNVLIGQPITTPPFAASFTPASTGTYVFLFAATDDQNATTVAQKTVNVVAPSGGGNGGGGTTPAAPDAPSIGASTHAVGSVTTNATAGTSAGSPATPLTFNVYRAGAASPLATGLPSPTYQDTQVVAGTSYSYEWTAVNPTGESARSGQSEPLAPLQSGGGTTYTSTKSYTTTAQDYADKCGSGTSGASVTKSSTKTATTSQADADSAALADAKAQAIAAITCPLPPANYNTTLSAALPAGSPGQGDGVVFVAASNQQLRYDTIANTSGNSISMQITDSADNSVSYVTFNQEYAGKPYAFDRSNGTTYAGTFPSADQNLTA